jgi:hypothetical protein
VRISLIELPETVRDNSRTSLSNSSSLVEDISTPFRIFKNKIKKKKRSQLYKEFTFAFLRRFGESFRHIVQPLIEENSSKKKNLFLQLTFHLPPIKSDVLD